MSASCEFRQLLQKFGVWKNINLGKYIALMKSEYKNTLITLLSIACSYGSGLFW